MEEAVKVTSVALSKKQEKAIAAAFKAMDLNHDGRLSGNEVKRACKQLGILLTKQELEEIMGEADDDGNGFVEFREFKRLVGHQLVIANYKNKKMQEAFRQFDKDGDGFITEVEIKQVFSESGVEMDDETVAELMKEADENGDGVISFEEFVHVVCEKDW